jgi:hypothetical protein
MTSLPVEEALAYLDALEAARNAALAVSEEKAEEAKLIKARQEGFRAAMGILGGELSVRHPEAHPTAKEPVRRRGRRPIPELILRELSYSGGAMTVTQIAKAIEYNPAGTETALERMASAGQVLRDEAGRWVIAREAGANMNGQAYAAE